MRTRASRPVQAPRINLYRIGAVLAQLGSFAATYGFIVAAVRGLAPLTLFLLAAGVEGLLMLAKSALFNANRKDDMVGVGAIAFDTVLNAGGLWPLTKNLAGTPPVIMFAEALGLSPEIGNLPALVLALLFGYLLAVLPHRLWHAGDEGAQE